MKSKYKFSQVAIRIIFLGVFALSLLACGCTDENVSSSNGSTENRDALPNQADISDSANVIDDGSQMMSDNDITNNGSGLVQDIVHFPTRQSAERFMEAADMPIGATVAQLKKELGEPQYVLKASDLPLAFKKDQLNADLADRLDMNANPVRGPRPVKGKIEANYRYYVMFEIWDNAKPPRPATSQFEMAWYNTAPVNAYTVYIYTDERFGTALSQYAGYVFFIENDAIKIVSNFRPWLRKSFIANQ